MTIKFNTKEEMDAYTKGYGDGMSYDKNFPMTFSFMGYSMNRLAEIIKKHEGKECTSRQKREEFRAKLADLGRSEETTFSSKVLEAYDLVHCPELRIKPIKLYENESPNGGTIRLETWPEGLVLWVNGKIKYKYWEDADNQK